LSGPYSGGGQNIINALTLAGQEAVEAGEIGDFQLETADSQTDPAVARQEAQNFIDQGVDFLYCGLLGASAFSVGKLASQNDILQFSTFASPIVDLEQCLENMFQHTRAMPGWGEGSLGYLAREKNVSTVFQLFSDQSFFAEYEDYVTGPLTDRYDIEFVGNKGFSLGTSDFSSAMTEAKNSGADVINLASFGSDIFAMMSQAVEFGLLEEDYKICVPSFDPSLAPNLPADLIGYEEAYFGLTGNYTGIDTEANNEFNSKFFEQFDRYPAAAGPFYNGCRTLLRAASEVGTVDTGEVKEQVRGHDMVPQLYGVDEYWRGCDKRSTKPPVVMRGGKTKSEVTNGEFFNVEAIIDDIDLTMYPCEEIACVQQNN
jgi:ABC-type branched-subunit amino acid transport system substrate-binding protein